ncbi:hypothetical protein FSP39_023048 [Pinctada imbricata]|uniref:WW domain-containing protein n=1 Tax=Pinctada imbricata TaxID=66713 RepID=A0AA89BVC4_PINIB|nr:hypothetical protein FSP39_023048 [Pinctada imbricata]
MNHPKPNLPHGWIVKQSKTYPDRVYYFNVHTGSSTWEVPALLKSFIKQVSVKIDNGDTNHKSFVFLSSAKQKKTLCLVSVCLTNCLVVTLLHKWL